MTTLHSHSGAPSNSVSELRMHEPIDFRINQVPEHSLRPELAVLAIVMISCFVVGLLALFQIS